MTKYTQFVVGVILAGIFVGPTAASDVVGARKVRVMQDTDKKGTVISLHADVENTFNLGKVQGTVDGLFHWVNGVAGNIIVDHGDGSHCVVDSQPSDRKATFSSGHKLVEFTYSEEGAFFHLKDDSVLDSDGEMVATPLSFTLIQDSMRAKSKGLLDHDIASLFDCSRDFFTIWDPEEDSRWGFSNVFRGVRNTFNDVVSTVGGAVGDVVDVITPDILGCPISDIAGLAFSIVSALGSVVVPAGKARCAAMGIAPVVGLFRGNFSSLPGRIVGVVADLAMECSGVASVERVVRQIYDSCLFDDDRRLELDEIIESRRLSAN